MKMSELRWTTIQELFVIDLKVPSGLDPLCLAAAIEAIISPPGIYQKLPCANCLTRSLTPNRYRKTGQYLQLPPCLVIGVIINPSARSIQYAESIQLNCVDMIGHRYRLGLWATHDLKTCVCEWQATNQWFIYEDDSVRGMVLEPGETIDYHLPGMQQMYWGYLSE